MALSTDTLVVADDVSKMLITFFTFGSITSRLLIDISDIYMCIYIYISIIYIYNIYILYIYLCMYVLVF